MGRGSQPIEFKAVSVHMKSEEIGPVPVHTQNVRSQIWLQLAHAGIDAQAAQWRAVDWSAAAED